MEVLKVLVLLAGFALLLTACNGGSQSLTPGEMQTDPRAVEIGEAESARVELLMSSGEMTVTGGAADLMDAEFRYNIGEWRPDVSYEVSGGIGLLTVRQGQTDRLVSGNARNEWDVRLNDETPIALRIESASASGELTLDTLTLTSLETSLSSGQFVTVVSGDQPALEQVTMGTSSGQILLSLQGSYPALTQVTLTGSSASLQLQLLGSFPVLDQVTVNNTSGATNINVNGEWSGDLDLNVEGSSGSVDVTVPANLNVNALVLVSSGTVSADGFERDGNTYTREADGGSDRSLDLTITVASSQVRLIVEGE